MAQGNDRLKIDSKDRDCLLSRLISQFHRGVTAMQWLWLSFI